MGFKEFFKKIFTSLRNSITVLARQGFQEFITNYLPLGIKIVADLIVAYPGKSFAELEAEFFVRFKDEVAINTPDNWVKAVWTFVVEHYKGKTAPPNTAVKLTL